MTIVTLPLRHVQHAPVHTQSTWAVLLFQRLSYPSTMVQKFSKACPAENSFHSDQRVELSCRQGADCGLGFFVKLGVHDENQRSSNRRSLSLFAVGSGRRYLSVSGIRRVSGDTLFNCLR